MPSTRNRTADKRGIFFFKEFLTAFFWHILTRTVKERAPFLRQLKERVTKGKLAHSFHVVKEKMLEDLFISSVVKIQHETTDPWFEKRSIKTPSSSIFGTRPKYWDMERHKPKRPSTREKKRGKCAAVFVLNALEKCQRGLRFTDSMFKHFPRFHYRHFGPHPKFGGRIFQFTSWSVSVWKNKNNGKYVEHFTFPLVWLIVWLW